jgi:hypothetical protein
MLFGAPEGTLCISVLQIGYFERSCSYISSTEGAHLVPTVMHFATPQARPLCFREENQVGILYQFQINSRFAPTIRCRAQWN